MMMKNKRGGALLLTLILVGIITTSAVAGSRIMISRQRVTGALEDSSIAYNSAESGIEYALARFRYDRDIDLPRCKDDSLPFNDCQGNGTDYPMENDNPKYVLRVDVTELGVNEDDDTVQIVREGTDIPKCSEEPGDICHQYFDLRVWYRTGEIVDGIIERDEGVSISGFTDGIDYFKLDYKTIGNIAPRDQANSTFQYGIQWELMGGTADRKAILCDNRDIAEGPCTINFIPYDRKTLRLNAYGAKMEYDLTAHPRPGYGFVFFGGTTTYIESTGYYGDAARKLRMEVNRNSGTILQLFDNVLYSGEGGLR